MTMNNIKVFVLMAGLTALFGAVGASVGGQGGMVTALFMAGAMNVFMYYTSSTMVLKMYGARVVSHAEAPELYGMVDRLRQRAGLPMPTVAIAPHDQPNAFATGRSPAHSVVCVTEGLLRLVTREELEGVVAHELAHIKNRDMLLQTVTATMAGAIGMLSQFAMFFGGRDEEGRGNPVAAIAMLILGPLAASVIQLAISRQREFKADAVGAEISGHPLAPEISAPTAQVNPLQAHGGGMLALFSTHPSTEQRVARLQELALAMR
jgi:heat shock protein HtpX